MKLLPVTPLLLLLSLFSLADSYLYPASRFAGTRTTALGALPLPGGGNTDKDIENIFKQNEEWVQENLRKDKDYFNKLGSGHTPEYLWIGNAAFAHALVYILRVCVCVVCARKCFVPRAKRIFVSILFQRMF
mmetsp:Transcript_10993/g.24224  ORF Transcript_10993/g.24224 Transcript_10993/m.24224 type:complete len:132 (-) Transcript_10993:801-1196(-)